MIRLVFQLWYFARVVAVIVPARKRAKSLIARLQLAIGFGAALALVVMIIITCLAILASLGVYRSPPATDTAADAVALGLTAITTWLLARIEPGIRDAVVLTQKLIDYAEDERRAQGVTDCLADAVDAVLDQDLTRKVNIVGYSMGGLVALDYLCPRASTSPDVSDDRCRQAVRVLVTIGHPADFVRLFYPSYLTTKRFTRSPEAVWTNIFIPADVLGSNFGDDGDDEAPREVAAGARVAELKLAHNVRYTDRRLTALNIWGQHGFLSHVGYWDEPTAGSCLPLVWQALVTRIAPAAANDEPGVPVNRPGPDRTPVAG